jgi:hypothetical protein
MTDHGKRPLATQDCESKRKILLHRFRKPSLDYRRDHHLKLPKRQSLNSHRRLWRFISAHAPHSNFSLVVVKNLFCQSTNMVRVDLIHIVLKPRQSQPPTMYIAIALCLPRQSSNKRSFNHSTHCSIFPLCSVSGQLY